MKRTAPFLILFALNLAACGPAEPESAANRFERTEREIMERQNALNAQVENELAQTERRLESEAALALNSLNAVASSTNAAEEAPAEPRAASAPGNRRR